VPPSGLKRRCRNIDIYKGYDGFNIVSNDIETQPAENNDDCRSKCVKLLGCQAVSWTKGICHLKSVRKPMKKAIGVFTQVIRGFLLACCREGWELYKGLTILGKNAGSERAATRFDCQPKCKARAGCRGYSWVHGVCYFKSARGTWSKNPTAYSAYMC
jgi:hypothetical protein